jgi:hypothetical protein
MICAKTIDGRISGHVCRSVSGAGWENLKRDGRQAPLGETTSESLGLTLDVRSEILARTRP